MLNSKEILKRAGYFYGRTKRTKFPTIEIKNEIVSDQVKSLCEALCEDINEELQKIKIALREGKNP